MNRFTKTLVASTLALACTSVFAAPVKLTTHNLTDAQSNAFVNGTIPSLHPTQPRSDGIVSWTEVRMACYGHVVDHKCTATIKMETDKANPVEVGIATMNIETGEITFKYTNDTRYTVTVNGPGETTLAYKK